MREAQHGTYSINSYLPNSKQACRRLGANPQNKTLLSPWRSLSNETIEDPARALLGANGYLLIEENSTHILDEDFIREPGTVRRVSYYNSNVDLMFRAECPRKKFPFHEIQGTAGRDLMFAWDVVNWAHGSGGTTVVGAEGLKCVPAYRRFTFAFTSPALLGVVLYKCSMITTGLWMNFSRTTGASLQKKQTPLPTKLSGQSRPWTLIVPKSAELCLRQGNLRRNMGSPMTFTAHLNPIFDQSCVLM